MNNSSVSELVPINLEFILLEPHQVAFDKAIDTHQISVLFAGRQSGKGEIAAMKFVERISSSKAISGINWIIAPSYNQARIQERKFLKYAGNLIISQQKQEKAYIIRPTKTNPFPIRVEIKTSEDPNKLRGEAIDTGWITEFAYITEEAFDAILPCIMTTQGKLILETTPRNLPWIRKKIVQKAIEQPNRYIIVKGRSEDNPYADRDILDMIRLSYSPEQARQELEGELVNITGRVFSMFDYERHVIPDLSPKEFEDGGRVFGGIDFGFNDPTVHIWIGLKDGVFYILDEHYERGTVYPEHASLIMNNDVHPFNTMIGRRWSDPSNPQGRIELSNYGVTSNPAIRAGLEKRQIIPARIRLITKLLNTDMLKICKSCQNTINEFEMYCYPSRKSNVNIGELPVDAMNHSIDAIGDAIFSETNGGRSLNYKRDEQGNFVINPIQPLRGKIDDIADKIWNFNYIRNKQQKKKFSLSEWN